jgi:hypothetical protein
LILITSSSIDGLLPDEGTRGLAKCGWLEFAKH